MSIASAARNARFPRVLIENVSPSVDCGRYPVKRVVRDRVDVGVDLIKDGHDLVAGRVCFRLAGEHSWHYAPLSYHYDEDRWFASFVVDRAGNWELIIEAWPDVFGTWRSELNKKFEARQDVSLELSEGALLLEAAARRARGEERALLRQRAAALTDRTCAPESRVQSASAEDLRALMGRHIDVKQVVRSRSYPIVVDVEKARFGSWYEMFPRSQAAEPGRHGTFADAEQQLPRLAELGFDVVYLPPIHPIGHTFRKGKNNSIGAEPNDVGSPWAIGNEAGGHDAVDPHLGTLEDFDRFVAAAERHGISVALDYALQCSPDHPWVKEHPQWFFIRPDGSIKYAENPPKKYQDIYPLDFWSSEREALWDACKELLRFWIGRGVRIFRVDNPHTKPLAFWEWVIAEIKREHPDIIFLAEAFTRPTRMKALAKLGFTQSYSYFTWRNTAAELRHYLTELTQTEMAEFYRPNF
ncbi:MAG TPA: maltotransferase domain-containing protein, partial [Terriglobales bacterium]|nr:maltotransferase domain-containing protein [Terriglobales bacterium]